MTAKEFGGLVAEAWLARRPHRIRCKWCGTWHTVDVPRRDLARWNEGAFVQDAFPYLTATERGLLHSGTCGSCWERMFPPEDQDGAT